MALILQFPAYRAHKSLSLTVAYLAKTTRSTSEIWGELRPLTMTGAQDAEKRTQLLRELNAANLENTPCA